MHSSNRFTLIMLALCAALTMAGCKSRPTKSLPPTSTPVPGSSPGNTYGKANPGDFEWTPDMAKAQGQLGKTLRSEGTLVSKTTDNRLWITLAGEDCFEFKRSVVQAPARAQLDKIATYLRANAEAQVRIVGHTDPVGKDSANNALSLERAASARDWLVARGVLATRIAIAGRGAADPIATNSTDEGRATNRRIELLIGERAEK
jgi:outer membrane protein OmpA-like peptidoglycan-associated protein